MNNNEKIEILNRHIESILPHILALQKDINDNPLGDIEEKPLRSQILSDFVRQKEALEAEKETLTNQG